MRARQSRLPIRKAFKRNLIFFVLLPVLIVFAVFVISLYYGFHARAINNIELVHESLSGMLTGEVSDTSMLLASVMYTNNSVIIDYAEACDNNSTLQGVRIIFPLLKPATATVCIIKSITIINDMYIPYLYMPKTRLRTLTTYLMNYANAQQGSWQTLADGIIIIMLPTVLLYIFFQKYILSGVVAGAVKE